MRKDVLEILNKNNVTVELKGYKETSGRDGYNMQGNIYVNGKKAIFAYDLGDGSPFDYNIINEKNSQPLLNIMDQLSELPAYPDDESLSDIQFDLEKLFIELVEDLIELRQLKRASKSKTLLKWAHGSYEGNSYSFFKHVFCSGVVNAIIKRMVEKGDETVQIWNVSESWKTYTIEELKAML